ncbi:MAG: hypothetical protein COZ59_06825, partial [Bacteroidetes bacterium CG_4_8_14_3_um_filter_31_14]
FYFFTTKKETKNPLPSFASSQTKAVRFSKLRMSQWFVGTRTIWSELGMPQWFVGTRTIWSEFRQDFMDRH